MTRLCVPDYGLPGAQSRALVSYQVVGVESLVAGIHQVNGPGLGIAVILCCEQIAIGRGGIYTDQDRVVAVEYLVMQTNPNLGEVLGLVDVSGALRSLLMELVYAAKADGDAQNVAHEFHHATVGGATNEGEGKNDLTQPRFGDRKIKQNRVICSGGSKGIVDRLKCPILLLVDEFSTDVILGCQVTDVD